MRVAKWGNSLAVRLPKALVDELRLKAGDELKVVDATGERLAVVKDERRKMALVLWTPAAGGSPCASPNGEIASL
jgi:antitoxin MazE